LENAKLSQPMKVWVKIDSGMHRLGFSPQQFESLKLRFYRSQNIQQNPGFMSHFASADESNQEYTLSQITCFDSCVHDLQGQQSLANSAGIFAFEQSHRDWIRPGIALYGVSPFAHLSAEDLGLQAVMELRSSLIAVRPHQAGESAGYGRIWRSQHDTYLGVVAIGYGDGYPRTAPEGTPVRINGRIVPIVGRVSMDMLTVDLGPKPMDQVGDEAIIWGAGLPVEDVAKHVGTIGYELVTKLTSRVPLYYKD
jgi:alanine racemase